MNDYDEGTPSLSLTLTATVDGAAADDPVAQMVALLDAARAAVEETGPDQSKVLFDINGNRVGHFSSGFWPAD